MAFLGLFEAFVKECYLPAPAHKRGQSFGKACLYPGPDLQRSDNPVCTERLFLAFHRNITQGLEFEISFSEQVCVFCYKDSP